MAKLINGNGNPAIYAAEDADMIASISGNVTAISDVGNQMAATAQDANTIGVADGVIITKEGRRIQLDAGSTDIFTIPTGSAGVTNYYIIGYKLTTGADSSQTCETFVQKMNSASETITEDTFRGGATDVYVSLYRVTQDGVNLDSIDALLPSMSSLSEINANLTQFKAHTAYITTSIGSNQIDIDISSLGFTTALYTCVCELYANQAVDYTITHEFINVNTIRLYVYTPSIALNNVALSMFVVGK